MTEIGGGPKSSPQPEVGLDGNVIYGRHRFVLNWRVCVWLWRVCVDDLDDGDDSNEDC